MRLSIIVLLTFVMNPVLANSASEALAKGDSLFKQKQYTQSFQLYEYVLDNEHMITPAMLLKMAFIKEGLGDISNALYYLNLYYLHTADKRVLSKMEELAEKKELSGYNFSDFEFFETLFYKYFIQIIATISTLAILMLSFIYYQKIKKQQNPVLSGVIMVFVLTALFYTLNFGRSYNKAVIKETNSVIMSGPSAGAEVLAIVKKGHRVNTDGSQDVWTRIEWNDQIGYIKNDKLKPIKF